MKEHPKSSRIHPSAIIGDRVTLGSRVCIGPNAVVLGPTEIQDDVWIGSGAAIGAPPEITDAKHNLAWDGEFDHAGVRIERGAVLRELVVVHQGADVTTVVGEGSWLLSRVYVAHDVQIGPGVTLSAGTSVGGRATIRQGATLGLNSTVHQGRSIGALAMIGMSSAVTRDIPPYAKAFGVPSRLHGVNQIGMERAGFSVEALAAAASIAEGMVPLRVPAEVEEELEWWSALEGRIPASSGIL